MTNTSKRKKYVSVKLSPAEKFALVYEPLCSVIFYILFMLFVYLIIPDKKKHPHNCNPTDPKEYKTERAYQKQIKRELTFVIDKDCKGYITYRVNRIHFKNTT